MHNYVLNGDISKMFRQIKVDPSQRKLQKIFWRDDELKPMKIYELNTLCYGVNCSPYLAMRTIKQLYIDEGSNYPIAASNPTAWYMDDFLDGRDSLEETILLRKQVSELLLQGGFKIRKWTSNSPQVLETIPVEERASNNILNLYDDTVKTLGMNFHPAKDEFSYSVNIADSPVTKRNMLSEIGRLWDPLGLLGPLVTAAKIMMQELWLEKLQWDDIVPQEIRFKWENFRRSLLTIPDITIPRGLKIQDKVTSIQLHVFNDASKLAYGACAYLRCSYESGNKSVRLIMAKSKVAPIKQLTLPRLELNAAVLGTNLSQFVQSTLPIVLESTYYWTDSSIVLAWLNKSPHQMNVFVANRVSQISQVSHVEQWRHVKSVDNPADIISRGASPQSLKQSSLWWNGPYWLIKDSGEWPSTNYPHQECVPVPEVKHETALATTTVEENPLWFRYSSMNKLVRVTAYCRRFVNNCKVSRHEREVGALTKEEIDKAWISIVKTVQSESFDREIKCLSNHKSIPKESKLLQLNPFLDCNGLLRVGGRLQNANISYDQKHPAILPSKHVVTNLIVMHYHLRNLHAGPQNLLHILR